MPDSPRALFFDAAGTLIEVAEPVGAVYARYFTEAGFPTAEGPANDAFRQIFKEAEPPRFQPGQPGEEGERAWWHDLVAGVFLRCHPDETTFPASPAFAALFAQLFDHYADPRAWRVFPDVVATLEQARPHGRLLVVSNFDHRLHGILEGLGLAPWFDHLVTSASAAARKPDPRIFQRALALAETPAGQTAHVGDSPHADRDGAAACGIRAYLLDRRTHSLPDFLDFCRIGAK